MSSAPERPCAVVIVDDNPTIRRGLRTLIERDTKRWTVTGEASGGVDAFELIRTLQPDAAIVDVEMPDGSGVELLAKLAENGLRIRAIVLSGYDRFDYVRSTLRSGAVDYLLKPLENEELISLLARLALELDLESEPTATIPPTRGGLGTEAALQDRFVSRLLHTASPWSGEKAREAARLGLEATGSFRLICVEGYGAGGELDEIVAERLAASLDSCLAGARGLLRPVRARMTGRVVLLIRGNDEAVEDAPRLVSVWADLCDQASLQYAISGRFHNLHACRARFGQLSATLERAYYSNVQLHGPSTPLAREDIGGQSLRDAREAVAQAVLLPDAEAAKVSIRSLLQLFVDAERPREDVRNALVATFAFVAAQAPCLESAQSLVIAESSFGLTLRDAEAIVCAFAERVRSARIDDNEARVMAVCRYIERHSGETLRLPDVAATVNSSPAHFARLFKRYTGEGFLHYLTRVRVENAARILESSDETVTTIGRRVGYSESVTFHRAFKRIMGVSPQRFREEARAG